MRPIKIYLTKPSWVTTDRCFVYKPCSGKLDIYGPLKDMADPFKPRS